MEELYGVGISNEALELLNFSAIYVRRENEICVGVVALCITQSYVKEILKFELRVHGGGYVFYKILLYFRGSVARLVMFLILTFTFLNLEVFSWFWSLFKV